MSTFVLKIRGQSAFPQQWIPAIPPLSWIASMISSSFSATSSGAAGENADPSVSIAGSSRKMMTGLPKAPSFRICQAAFMASFLTTASKSCSLWMMSRPCSSL